MLIIEELSSFVEELSDIESSTISGGVNTGFGTAVSDFARNPDYGFGANGFQATPGVAVTRPTDPHTFSQTGYIATIDPPGPKFDLTP